MGKKLQYYQHATIFSEDNLPISQSNSKRSLQVLLIGNHFHHKMNINYAQGIVLIVLACVLHTNCAKPDKPLEKVPSKSIHKDDQKSLDVKKNDSAAEKMLLNIATIIQGSIDEKTMNNKEFKIKLDNLYKNLVMMKIKKLITKHTIKVNDIKKKYEKDVKILKIMNSMPDSGSSKNSNKSSKKSNKK